MSNGLTFYTPFVCLALMRGGLYARATSTKDDRIAHITSLYYNSLKNGKIEPRRWLFWTLLWRNVRWLVWTTSIWRCDRWWLTIRWLTRFWFIFEEREKRACMGSAFEHSRWLCAYRDDLNHLDWASWRIISAILFVLIKIKQRQCVPQSVDYCIISIIHECLCY